MEKEGIDEENVIVIFDDDDKCWYLMEMRVYM